MNRKVILYIAVSLDGFIADSNGGANWISGHGKAPESSKDYDMFYETIDTVVMGSTTYEQIINELSKDIWPYKGKTSYIITSRCLPKDNNVDFINSNISNFIRELKNKYGKNIWVVGGAKLANELIKSDLIDEYQITTIPIILGSGISLFDRNNPNLKLHLDRYSTYDGMIFANYSRL